MDIHKSKMQASLLVVLFAALASADILYEDNFDTLDKSKWYLEVVKYPHNNELEYYTDRTENIDVQDGHLVITPLRENYGGKQYTSGRMHSLFHWKYGRAEVRAKLPNGYGLWPAIWMMPQYSVYGGWPQSGEIDICEARGQNLNQIASTIHYGTPSNHYWITSGDLTTGCSIDQYHVYTVDWTPTQLVYRLDGKAYYVQDLTNIANNWMYSAPGQPFDQDFYMILNVAIGGDYLDDPDSSTKWNYPDAEMYVDYVRVYPLEDISTYQCAAKPTASVSDVCGSIGWACSSDNTYADVSSACTQQLMNCCSGATSCSSDETIQMANAVFQLYDSQLNSDTSCDFSGTAERTYVLNDGPAGMQLEDSAECMIYDWANNDQICGSMQWACYDQSYTDVSGACNAASDMLSCCNSNAWSCDSTRLNAAAQNVFNTYYQNMPSSSSCDFGGICYLSGGLEPLACTDGYDV